MENDEDKIAQLGTITKEELQELDIKFLVVLSVVPKFPEDQISFQIIDKVMQNEINIIALPLIEFIIALPSSYPSNQKPLFLQRIKFYSEFGKYDDFITEQINQKWSEEMPVLYDIAIFLQDEFVE